MAKRATKKEEALQLMNIVPNTVWGMQKGREKADVVACWALGHGAAGLVDCDGRLQAERIASNILPNGKQLPFLASMATENKIRRDPSKKGGSLLRYPTRARPAVA